MTDARLRDSNSAYVILCIAADTAFDSKASVCQPANMT